MHVSWNNMTLASLSNTTGSPKLIAETLVNSLRQPRGKTVHEFRCCRNYLSHDTHE